MSGHGSGKVILLGEHAVVHGAPAIAGGLSLGAWATTREGDVALRVAPWDVLVRPGDGSALGAALSALFAARRAEAGTGERPRDRALDVTVTLPGSAGLGSSAAIGVAALRALDAADGLVRDFDRSQTIALAWERVFHGNPSGIDSAVALKGGLVRFERHPAPGAPMARDLPQRRPLRLVIGHSGQPGSTRDTVAAVAAIREADPTAFSRTLEVFARLVAEGERAIAEGELAALGEALVHAQRELAAWRVSTPRLDAMCARAMEAGALGAKLTGGGGGGCMIALVSSDDAMERVRTALAEMGHPVFEATIGATIVGAASAPAGETT